MIKAFALLVIILSVGYMSVDGPKPSGQVDAFRFFTYVLLFLFGLIVLCVEMYG